MLNLNNISKLVGLAGAVSSSGKTDTTDMVVLDVLLSMEDKAVLIDEEKYKISPNCKTCCCPCGNTSDYDLEEFSLDSSELQNCKLTLLEALVFYCKKHNALPECCYKVLSYFGYRLSIDSYIELMNELKK